MKRQLMKLSVAAVLAAGLALAQTTPQTTPQPAEPAQPAPARKHPLGRAAMHKRMLQALNLTDSQKQQAKAIFQQTREGAKPMVEQLKQNREALTAAVKSNNVG